MRRLPLAFAASLSFFVGSRTALAAGGVGPCSSNVEQCQEAPIAFSREATLPVQGGFDTGWVPQGSALQVHLFAQLFASTKIDMAGELVTSWPDVLTLKTPGKPGAGNIAIHYGVDVGAEAKLHITVLGQNFDWTGPIPYTPQFDFQVDAQQPFDPWAFQGVTVDGSTLTQQLAKVSATSFIGVNIPGLDGGFALDTKVDLAATYRTDSMVITHIDGQPVAGGPILAEDAATLAAYIGGPSVELDVHPEGRVSYAGILHLIPAFYISTIGPDFDIPIVDIPIPFSIDQNDWVFDSVRVHVPLPDITVVGDPTDGSPPMEPGLEADLGTVEVGVQSAKKVTVQNDGEAELASTFSSSDPEHFTLSSPSSKLAHAHAFDELVIFRAAEPGDYSATISITSNDPDEPVRTILVKATAVSGAGASPIIPIAAEPATGCGCRTADGDVPDAGRVGGLAGVVALLSLLRRRSGKRLSKPL